MKILSEKSKRKRKQLYAEDKDCGICGYPIINPLDHKAVTIDHIKPVSKGGKRMNNLQLAHRKCNSIKGDLPNMDKRIYMQPKMVKHLKQMKERYGYEPFSPTQNPKLEGDV